MFVWNLKLEQLREVDLFTASFFFFFLIEPEIYCFSKKSGLGNCMLILGAQRHAKCLVMALTTLISQFRT